MKATPKKGKPTPKEAPAPEKKAKRKASRGGGDSMAKLKSLFVNHIEKIVLSGMALVALLLIYGGFARERIATSPDTVKQAIAEAERTLSASTWADEKPKRAPGVDTFDEVATLDAKPVSVDSYVWKQPLHPRLAERGKQRIDPPLLAPIELQVVPEYGALAVNPKTDGSSSRPLGTAEDETSYTLPEKTSNKISSQRVSGNSFESTYFIGITGLIPYKQQFDLYQEAFKDAADYQAERDQPRYFGLMVERAEVGPDGKPGDWVALDPAKPFEERKRWSSTVEEIADPDYLLRDARDLLAEIPPVALRDVARWALHPQIPRVKNEVMERGSTENSGSTEAKGEGAGKSESSGGGRNWASAAAGREGTPSNGAANRELAESSADNVEAQPIIKYPHAMFRYFDFTVEPGKAYQYRVRAVLDDPNDPEQGQPPSDAVCETDVIIRRQGMVGQKMAHYRLSDWSEPSRTVTLPAGKSVLLGSITEPATSPVGEDKRLLLPRKPEDEPKVSMLALSWDAAHAYDISTPVEAMRGTLLNGIDKDKSRAIDLSASRIRKVNAFEYKTEALVLDIYGGDTLSAASTYKGITAPGYVVVLNSAGELEIHGQTQDFERYDFNSIPDEEKEGFGAPTTSGDKGEGGEGPVGEPGRNGEGGEGRRQNSRRNRNPQPATEPGR